MRLRSPVAVDAMGVEPISPANGILLHTRMTCGAAQQLSRPVAGVGASVRAGPVAGNRSLVAVKHAPKNHAD